MVLLSALEDFVSRTLSSVPTLLGRVHFVASLRSGARYEHWGLAHVHGCDAANDAISRAHTEVWIEVLRTPLPALMSDLENRAPGTPAKWLERTAAPAGLVPADTAGGSRRHFESVLLAVSELSAARRSIGHAA